MKHRLVVIALAATLAVAGCSSSSNNDTGSGGGGAAGDLPPCPLDALASRDSAAGPVDVTVWHTTGQKTLETLDALVAQYNASQSKVRVKLENQGTTYDEIQQKFNAAVRDKKLPAVLLVDDTFTRSMADSGVILPAQSCINADNYDMSPFRQGARDYYTIDGAVWPASVNIGTVLLSYNTNHFRRAGLDPANPPKTLAEVRAAAEQIKAAGISDKPFVHTLSPWKTEFWLTGVKSPVVNNDNGRGDGQTDAGALTDNPEALELFTWFNDMNSAGLMESISDSPGQINQFLAMAQQKSSMLIESSSAATSIEAFLGGNLDTTGLGIDPNAAKDLSGLDISAAVLPGITADSTGKTQMGGNAWYMTNTVAPEVQAGAWDFMKFMNTEEAQAKMLIGGSFLPYRSSVNDRQDVKDFYAASLSGQWLKLADDQVATIDPAFPGPLIGPYDEFRKALREWQDKMIFTGVSPADALAGAQQQVTDALAAYNQGTG
jgi:sn-glycerol 3-phosphate transport system substrate-binding protein